MVGTGAHPSLAGPNLSRAAASGPVGLSNTLRDGPRQMQPDTPLGRRFLQRFRLELTWLCTRVPLRLLRTKAIDKVNARLALVQSVRAGTAEPSALHTEQMARPVYVGSGPWLRQMFQPPPRLRRGPGRLGVRVPTLAVTGRGGHGGHAGSLLSGAANGRMRKPGAATTEAQSRCSGSADVEMESS